MKLLNFENWSSGKLSKIQLMLSINVNNKKCAPKFVFFNGRKIRKFWMIFDV